MSIFESGMLEKCQKTEEKMYTFIDPPVGEIVLCI